MSGGTLCLALALILVKGEGNSRALFYSLNYLLQY